MGEKSRGGIAKSPAGECGASGLRLEDLEAAHEDEAAVGAGDAARHVAVLV